MYTDAYLSVKSFIQKLGRDRLYTYSATAAFFIILSIFPFLILLLTLLQYTSIEEGFILDRISFLLPDVLIPLAEQLVDEVYNTTSGAVVIFASAVGGIWSASKGVMALIRGINVCFNINDKRNYFSVRLLSCVYTLVLLITLIFSMVMLVFGSAIYNSIKPILGNLSAVIVFVLKNRLLVSLALFLLLFAVMYTVLPAKSNKFHRMIPGALIAAGGWIGLSTLISLYVKIFPNFSYTYGSLTSFILLMLWLYFGMYIIFICAEINFYINSLLDAWQIKRSRDKAIKYENRKNAKEHRVHQREQLRSEPGLPQNSYNEEAASKENDES